MWTLYFYNKSGDQFVGDLFDAYPTKVVAIKEAIQSLEFGIYESANVVHNESGYFIKFDIRDDGNIW